MHAFSVGLLCFLLLQLNETLESICSVRGFPPLVISPRNRNLLFAMAQFSFVFSVESFAALYFDSYVFNPTATPAAPAAADGSSSSNSSSSSSNSTDKGGLFGGIPLQKLLEAEVLHQQLQQQQQQQDGSSSSTSRRRKHKETEEETKETANTPADVYTQLELFEVALWGDFYRDPETHRIVSSPPFPVCTPPPAAVPAAATAAAVACCSTSSSSCCCICYATAAAATAVPAAAAAAEAAAAA